jgi:hypothetical protein
MRNAAFLALLLAAAPAGAASLLGPDGTTYEIRSRLVAGSPQLALVLSYPDGTSTLEVVPGTHGLDEERHARIVLDDRSQSVFLVWEQRLHGVFSQLLLAERSAHGDWSQPIELSGNPFAERSSLIVSVDAGRPGLAVGEDSLEQRQLISLLWAEQAGPGYRVMFSPVALLDGIYPGANAALPLTDFATSVTPADEQLLSKPALSRANEPETVAIAFFDPASQHFQRAMIRALPMALTDFADKARAEIIELGAHTPQSPRQFFADKARAEIIELGSKVHQSLQVFAADKIQSALLADPETNIEMLADKARAEIIELGARALDPVPGRAGTFVAIATGSAMGGDFELIWLEPLERPSIPPGAVVVSTMVSPTGLMAALVWELDGVYYYAESRDSSWGPSLVLATSADHAAAAIDLLGARVAHH